MTRQGSQISLKNETGIVASPTGLSTPTDLSNEQKKQAVIDAIVKDVHDIPGRPYAVSARNLDAMLKNIEKNNSGEYPEILRNLSRLCAAEDGPAELVRIKYDIAADLIYEMSDPHRRIHDGDSLACALTAKLHLENHVLDYSSNITDLVCKGYTYMSTTDDGVKLGLMNYQEGMFTGLKDRTLGSALFQDVLLSHLGCHEEGTMPIKIEDGFESTRGKAGRTFSANKEVSTSPDSFEMVLNKIEDCAKSGKDGLISMIVGVHGKHVFEICKSSDGVPDGYVKLSDPRKIGKDFPPEFRKIAKDNGDGTHTIKLTDLTEKNLYLAVVESADERDFGRTTGIREWQYKKDANGPILTSYQYSLPFSLYDEDKKKKENLPTMAVFDANTVLDEEKRRKKVA